MELPILGKNGSVITWASSNTDVIAVDGTVVRPAAGSEDAVVTLTATITCGDASETATFTVTVKAEVASGESTVLATFTFGENGSAAHVDGNDLGVSKTYEENGYSLALTDMSKVFGPAYDAKGNSAIKLGTSKVVGSFSFEVGEDVKSVVIYVAQYKTNTTKVSINGTEYTITTASDSGEYTALTIDTSTVKTITFNTVSGGARCMIDTIEFYS